MTRVKADDRALISALVWRACGNARHITVPGAPLADLICPQENLGVGFARAVAEAFDLAVKDKDALNSSAATSTKSTHSRTGRLQNRPKRARLEEDREVDPEEREVFQRAQQSFVEAFSEVPVNSRGIAHGPSTQIGRFHNMDAVNAKGVHDDFMHTWVSSTGLADLCNRGEIRNKTIFTDKQRALLGKILISFDRSMFYEEDGSCSVCHEATAKGQSYTLCTAEGCGRPLILPPQDGSIIHSCGLHGEHAQCSTRLGRPASEKCPFERVTFMDKYRQAKDAVIINFTKQRKPSRQQQGKTDKDGKDAEAEAGQDDDDDDDDGITRRVDLIDGVYEVKELVEE